MTVNYRGDELNKEFSKGRDIRRRYPDPPKKKNDQSKRRKKRPNGKKKVPRA